MLRRFRALVALAALNSASVGAQKAEDWPTYGHDKGGQRFSPLADIDPGNVGQLEVAWVYRLRAGFVAPTPDPQAEARRQAEGAGPPAPAGRPPLFGSQATPLVIEGVMYLTTPYGRVVALDPVSGKEVWVREIPGPGQPSLRGVEYWPGDAVAPPRLFFGTRDGRLIGLDAKTGEFAAGFGQDGVVDMKTPEILNGAPGGNYGMTSPPLVFRNLVITGSAVQEFPPKGPAGDVRAWDARTGELVWTFHSVPRQGEPGYETWEPGSAEQRSGVNVWGFMTVDADRGIVYMPFAAPAFDRYGGDRKGDNLYSTSLVAADAATGRYLWHFQLVHHDIWDNDAQSPPLLFEATVDGKPVPAVAVTSKAGLMFFLDRVSGKPIFPLEERPVPASDVPGEQASPTQPFPVVTPPLSRSSFDPAIDVTTVTEELNRWCTDWIKQHDMIGSTIFQPVRFNRPTISFPGLQGGANWGGGAYDPRTGLLFINTNDLGQVTSLVPSNGPLPFERGRPSDRFMQPGTRLLCQQPPWGQLHAIDTRTGRIAWQSTLGVSDNLPEGRRATGRPNIGGPIVTAGGLVFIGATDDSRFRAYDAQSGRELWAHKLEAAAHATPITYRGADGRQYVVVTATGGSFLNSPTTAGTVVAFALPKGASE